MPALLPALERSTSVVIQSPHNDYLEKVDRFLILNLLGPASSVRELQLLHPPMWYLAECVIESLRAGSRVRFLSFSTKITDDDE